MRISVHRNNAEEGEVNESEIAGLLRKKKRAAASSATEKRATAAAILANSEKDNMNQRVAAD